MSKLDNEKYWQQRSEQRIISAEKRILRFENEMKEQFNRAYEEIENKIAKFYFKYAEDNELDYADAVKYLTANERKEFQKDVKFYIEKAKDAEYREEHKQYLQALSTRARVNRLEALKASIKHEAHGLYEGYLKAGTQITFDDILKDTFYHTIFDLEQFTGLAVSFDRISGNILKSLVEYPWSGSNYSDKIWGNVDKFSKKLENMLTSGIIQGKSNQDMARELKKATESSYKDAIRLVRTETNFIANEATNKAYAEYGVERYQYLATLDLRTSEVCRKMDREVFKLVDKIVGVNYPPLHPHCRSTTTPYFDDLEGTRLAKGSDGKYYKVDRNMKYKDWYKQHVLNDPKELASEKKIKNKSGDKKQYEEYRAVLGKNAPKSFDDFQDLKYNKTNDWANIQKTYRVKNKEFRKKDFNAPDVKGGSSSDNRDSFNLEKYKKGLLEKLEQSSGQKDHVETLKYYAEITEYVEDLKNKAPLSYSRADDVIKFNPKHEYISEYDMDYALTHELSHRADELIYRSWENDKFKQSIDICSKRVVDDIEKIQVYFNPGGKYENDMAISDIMGALSKGKLDLFIGHDPKYWEKDTNVSAEVFANISSIDVLGRDNVEDILEIFKEIYEEYKNIVGGGV